MKRSSLLTLLALMLVIGVYGQDAYTKRFVPPSPTASSLGQYGEVPVSLYTGIANIQIPIYSVSERGLSVPISLGYHASGIKVDQMPSWVGMGWSLGAGGTITRTIMGLPDESTHGYYAHADRLEDFINGVSDANLTEKDEDVAWWTATGVWDSEPDVYYYNFGGMSGKMVFDKTGTPRMVPHNNMKVVGNVTTGFTVTSSNGTVYVFDQFEYTDVTGSGNDPNLVSGRTAFNLSSITTTNGAAITFVYENEDESYTVSSNQSQVHNMPGFTDSDCTVSGSVSYNQNDLTTSVKRLSEIHSASIRVKFIENSLPNSFGMKYLDKIEVYDQDNLVTPIKQFDFTLGNFGSGNTRGKLESIVEKDGAGNALSPYTFTYNDVTFPARLSSKQDHWGYYNSNTSTDLIPASSQFTYTVTGSPHTINYSGANRAPDGTKSQALMLTRVTYPTGGHTTFEFEQHTYSTLGTSRIYENLNYDVSEAQNIEAGSFGTATSSLFEIGATQQVAVTIAVTGLSGNLNDNPGRIEIKNSSGTVIHSKQLSAVGNGNVYSDHEEVLTWTLTPGTYELYAISDFGEVIKASCNYLTPVVITEPTPPTIGVENAGGVRIKKITIHDGINAANDRVKTYDYHEGSSSNGVLLFQPIYERFNTNIVRVQMEDGTGDAGQIVVYIYKECPLFTRSSSNMSALGATHGSHIGYSKVTEYLGEGSVTNGKSEYEFTSSIEYPDTPSGLVAFPAALTSYDYKRGLLKKRTDYRYDGVNSYSSLKENTTTYVFRDDVNKTSIPAFKIAISKNYFGEEDRNEYSVSSYNHVSQWYYSDSQVALLKDQTGNGSISTSTTYTYGATHLQPSSITTTNSEGETEVAEMKYAQDLSNTLLISKHMLTQVLEQTTKVNSRVTTKAETTYATLNGRVLPTGFKAYPRGGTDLIEVNYGYDANGNVNQVSRDGELPKAYFWAYDDEVPIAEGMNISSTDLSAAIAWAVTNMDSPPSGVTTISGLITYVGNMTTASQRQAWANFSAKLNQHSSAKYAQIGTMTYKRGFGMTSQTAPNGMVSYYEYDAHGRLKYVKDRDGNILKMNDYAYKISASTTGN